MLRAFSIPAEIMTMLDKNPEFREITFAFANRIREVLGIEIQCVADGERLVRLLTTLLLRSETDRCRRRET